MKTLIIILINVSIIFANISIILISRAEAISQKRIDCLEQGRIYAGENFCANK